MGIFQDMVEVVNRTSETLSLRYDGQDMAIPPNYTADGEAIEDVRTMIPRQCIPYALSQNPVMGSEDPSDPSNFESLVGIIDPKKNPKKHHSWYNCDFLPKQEQGIENMTRVNLRDVIADDPQVKDILVRGRKIDQVRPGQDGQDVFQKPQGA